MIVTLQEARAQARVDESEADAELTLKIMAASKAVVTYLKLADEAAIPVDVLPVAKLATLIMVAEYYKNREAAQDGEVDSRYGYGYLPRPAVALLYPYRDPTVA